MAGVSPLCVGSCVDDLAASDVGGASSSWSDSSLNLVNSTSSSSSAASSKLGCEIGGASVLGGAEEDEAAAVGCEAGCCCVMGVTSSVVLTGTAGGEGVFGIPVTGALLEDDGGGGATPVTAAELTRLGAVVTAGSC